MNCFRRLTAIVMSASLAFMAVGCGSTKNTNNVKPEQEAQSSDPAPNVVYDVPTMVPSALVDQNGYRTGAEKVVTFKGSDLPELFYIYNLETGELAYTGQMRDTNHEEDGEEIKEGYFTDLVEDGTYYIYADNIGSSYSFRIKNDLYGDIFRQALRKYYTNRCGMSLSEELAGEDAHAACHTQEAHLQEDPDKTLDVSGGWHLNAEADREVELGCKIAQNLLLAYEMKPESIPDDTGIPESGNGIPDILDEVRYEIEWLMKMQDERTGGVYGAALTVRNESEDLMQAQVEVTPVTMDATIRFATLLAEFSFLYQSYDSDFATKCLKCADRAYSLYAGTENVREKPEGFYAAAQLYRATGSSDYEQVLTSYFESGKYSSLFEENEDIFLGCITYISTNQKVNVDICSKIMKLLMKKTTSIVDAARSSGFMVTSKDHAQLLDDMRTITITDHIIYNYEYTTIIENHAHYLMGRNPEAVNYITDTTERTYLNTDEGMGIMNQPLLNAMFIFMLNVIKE
ncbi:glycoside hydrolase family 9 protein [Butyrivibrio sp. INlla16]|uniref:glycoside hydrolase family 9 protein n=1 Tax=Butyrivibrio sp. INlla16 TaxID=1520807 RepID=UPI00088FFB6E|nr:glycoside hydrolase family 9 protein [Butyrivibrio sp. INlla16]SDB64849.1 N-terminal ig-like domain of cellulase [Butyrivibrio sp. INlla16]